MANITNLNTNKLKSLLKENGLSMKYFNEKLGKNRSFLSNVLTGSDSIDQNELSFIANKLNTTIEYLTDQSEQKEKAPGDIPEAIEDVPDWRGIAFALHSTKGQLSDKDIKEVAEFIAFKALQKKEKK